MAEWHLKALKKARGLWPKESNEGSLSECETYCYLLTGRARRGEWVLDESLPGDQFRFCSWLDWIAHADNR
jgi:hypothetical protein